MNNDINHDERLPWVRVQNNNGGDHQREYLKWSIQETQRMLRLPAHERVLAYEMYGDDLTGPDKHTILQSLAAGVPGRAGEEGQ